MKLIEILEPEKYNIYCDMDGVLTDFDKAYLDLTGKNIKGVPIKNNKGEEFWGPIEKAGESFWENMEWTKDGKILWDYISDYNPKILSAPSQKRDSRTGKMKWVDRELPGTELILKSAEEKQHLVESDKDILIDDRSDNINRWIRAGGIGILHTSAENTIKRLKQFHL